MSTTNQPDWELIANLGDVNPIDYGGYFIYKDRTGQYTEEAERCEPTDDTAKTHEIHRFILDRCTDENGVLSDNPYHKDHHVWFAKDLPAVAHFADLPDIRVMLCSADPLDRARAYEAIGSYHGFANLDHYPLTLPRHETQARYGEDVDPLCQVIVGNIGTVYTGHDEDKARATFDKYKEIVDAPHGRAAGETVTLMVGDELEEEYTPEPATDLDTEPQEDDYIISDRRGGGYNVYRGGTCILSTTADGFDDLLPLIRGDMEEQKYWPAVWRERERGGFDVINTTTGDIIQ